MHTIDNKNNQLLSSKNCLSTLRSNFHVLFLTAVISLLEKRVAETEVQRRPWGPTVTTGAGMK